MFMCVKNKHFVLKTYIEFSLKVRDVIKLARKKLTPESKLCEHLISFFEK